MMTVRCTEQFKVKNATFRAGEEYIGNVINKEWCVVDSVGIPADDYHLHFEEIEEVVETKEFTEKDACAPAHERAINYPEPDILIDWLGEDDNKESDDKIKRTLWDKIKEWYDNWEIIQWYR